MNQNPTAARHNSSAFSNRFRFKLRFTWGTIPARGHRVKSFFFFSNRCFSAFHTALIIKVALSKGARTRIALFTSIIFSNPHFMISPCRTSKVSRAACLFVENEVGASMVTSRISARCNLKFFSLSWKRSSASPVSSLCRFVRAFPRVNNHNTSGTRKPKGPSKGADASKMCLEPPSI